MTTDALNQTRAILTTALELIRDDDEVAREVALIPRVRNFVLSPDHPLRTGEPSEELVEVVAAHLYNGLPRSVRLGVPLWCDGPDDAIVARYRAAACSALRAALAVLRV